MVVSLALGQIFHRDVPLVVEQIMIVKPSQTYRNVHHGEIGKRFGFQIPVESETKAKANNGTKNMTRKHEDFVN